MKTRSRYCILFQVLYSPAGSRYFADEFERTLVGWHGTYDPPRGMDGESMMPQRR